MLVGISSVGVAVATIATVGAGLYGVGWRGCGHGGHHDGYCESLVRGLQ